ncbi:MAG: PAS domain-containing protein [Candidatus Nitricoxidivorans perseverans]|uniref:histidine kinase n=1 Tax=Candidatus Nitricoxidivorans perseverans TaxID=2975601 RepID=A0AA49IWP3_9PROT|nr:MAG: PAS domain-containing protein [Candidatus Nitricoxidivorans perseverans]
MTIHPLRPLHSLRARLMLLMLLAAVPAFLVIGYFVYLLDRHETENHEKAMLVFARSLADEHRENLDSVRLLLISLANMPEIHTGEGPACAKMIAGVHTLAPPHIANLFVIRPDGDILCGAQEPARRLNVADMPYFRHALETEGPRIGEYHVSRRNNEPMLVVTHTVRENVNGKTAAVLAAAIDLSWLARQPYLAGQPAGTVYAIFDNAGTVLLRQPGSDRIGRSIAGHPHWRTLSALRGAAIFRGRDADEVERIFAYAPLGPAENPYARLVVGMPPAVMGSSSREFLILGLEGLAVALALSLLAGWFGSGAIILKPLEPVLATVHRVAEGDLSARTASAGAQDDEISRLATEVDRMAEALSQRDRALTEARDRAQAYLDVVGVMVVALNEKGNVALANRKACEVLGCGPEGQCVGGNWFETWLPPESRAPVRRVFDRIMADETNQTKYYENHILTTHGRRRLIAWHNTPLRDKSGRVIGVLSAGQDITDLRRTEDALRDSKNRYQALVENIPGAVFRRGIGSPCRMEHVGSAIESLTGVAAGRFIDGSACYRDFIHEDDFAGVEQAISEGVAARRPYVVEYRLRHQVEKAWRWVFERGQATYDESGKPLWLDGVIADITDKKLTEEEHERLQAQLQQAQKMEALGQLTGGIAHDFNNILASVLGFAKLALRRYVPDADSELASHLREVIAASERARDLVARMLAFSRTRPGSRATQIPPLPLVKETISMLTATIPAGIRIEMRSAADIPDIVIDPVDFHQIVMNLVINARDAVGDRGRIEIGLARARIDGATCAACCAAFSGDWLELRVADDGHGIPPDVLPHIFEPFFTTKEVGKGTGMGLAMVHGLVRRAGGHLLVETGAAPPRKGTAFRVFLPMATTADPPAAGPAPSVPPASPPAGRGNILVVDDELSVLRLMGAALEADGWRASTFGNPLLALACFRDAPDDFDAVITDQSMPDMTGAELIKALHMARPNLPAILCTGYGDGLDEAFVRQLGASRFFQKPMDMDELLTALADMVAGTGKAPRSRNPAPDTR